MLAKLHINNVHPCDNGIYVSGTKSGGMLHFNGKTVFMAVTLPEGTHNARPFRDGVLYNDTKSNCVRYSSRDGKEDRKLAVPQYDRDDLLSKGVDSTKVARQGFGRGLCVISDNIIATGSSPSTISIHDFEAGETLARINLSMDVRNAIHGLEVWPYN